jgi:hypothetical protein
LININISSLYGSKPKVATDERSILRKLISAKFSVAANAARAS